MVSMSLARILDEKVVRDFRQLFYEITGLFTSFYFPSWKKGQVDFVPRNSMLRFCKLIQCSEEGMCRCRWSDDGASRAAQKAGKPLITPCHAGVTGVAVPVFYRESFLGTVFAGDFLIRPQSDEQFGKVRKKLRDLPVDFAELEKAYYEIPVVPLATIKIAVNLLSLIVNYIVDREQIIYLQEDIYQRQKEIAIALGARTELEKGLMEKMDEIKELRGRLLAATTADKTVVLTENQDTRRKRIIKEALVFVDNYYSEDITLKDVAEHINLSPSYLSTIFHKEYGCTFVDYLIQKRMSKACELLKEGKLNVTQVSMRVGYYNVSYFNQLFKRVVGVPPGKYRNEALSGRVDS